MFWRSKPPGNPSAESERGRNCAPDLDEDPAESQSPLDTNPGSFRQVKADEYRNWFRTYVRNGGTPTHFFEGPIDTEDLYVATEDFYLPGAYGADSIEIIVPEGVEYIGGDLGHCTLYLPKGQVSEDHFPPVVPLYNDLTMMALPGMSEFAEEKRLEAAEAEARFDDYFADDEPDPTPLHAHEVTAQDAAVIRMMVGAEFSNDRTVTLPSGKTITSGEMRRWIKTQRRLRMPKSEPR